MPATQDSLLPMLYASSTYLDLDELGDTTECSLCFEKYSWKIDSETPLRSRCGHIFGLACLTNLVSTHDPSRPRFPPCPHCRADFLNMSTDSSPEPPPLLSAQTLSGHWNVSSIVPVQQNVGERRGSIHQEPRRSQTVRALSNQQNTVSRDESLDTTLESTLPLRLQTPNGQQSTSPTPAASTSRSGNTQQASGERPGTLFSRMIGRHRQAGLIPLRDEIEVEVETEPANRRSQALDRIDNECRIRDEQEIQNWAQGLRSIRYSNAPITSDQRQWILRTELLWLRLIYAALRLRSRQSANILLEYESLYDIWYALKDYHLANSAAEGVLILETQVLGPWRNLMDHLDHADEIGIGDDELDCMCHELSDDRPWMFHYQYQLTWKSLRGNRY